MSEGEELYDSTAGEEIELLTEVLLAVNDLDHRPEGAELDRLLGVAGATPEAHRDRPPP